MILLQIWFDISLGENTWPREIFPAILRSIINSREIMAALVKVSAEAGATRMPKKPLLLRQSSSVERAGQSLERSVRAYLDSLEEKSETAIRFSRPELEIGLQRVHLTLEIKASLLAEATKNRVEEGAVIEKKEDPGADTEPGGWINLVRSTVNY